jgi:hypothetical protein
MKNPIFGNGIVVDPFLKCYPPNPLECYPLETLPTPWTVLGFKFIQNIGYSFRETLKLQFN